jgi:hypothetical protein
VFPCLDPISPVNRRSLVDITLLMSFDSATKENLRGQSSGHGVAYNCGGYELPVEAGPLAHERVHTPKKAGRAVAIREDGELKSGRTRRIRCSPPAAKALLRPYTPS